MQRVWVGDGDISASGDGGGKEYQGGLAGRWFGGKGGLAGSNHV